VRVLQVTILWYAIFTFLCGFAQDFTQLFIFRALQGLGFGGEWAAGAVLMGEVIQDRYRGRAVGIVQTGWSIGWGAAALLYTVLIATLPEAVAWRAMFWVGLAPAALVFWIRRYVEEPELNRSRTPPSRASVTMPGAESARCFLHWSAFSRLRSASDPPSRYSA
jgi:MFS family permease